MTKLLIKFSIIRYYIAIKRYNLIIKRGRYEYAEMEKKIHSKLKH